ncbi:MAG: bifunctional diguanylate cyclase/phosphodiesterase [Pseudomonadota bacterium]
MFSTFKTGLLTDPISALLKKQHEGIVEATFLAVDAPVPAPERGQLVLPLKHNGKKAGTLVLQLAPGTAIPSVTPRIQPVLDCAAQTLVVASDVARNGDLQMLRLANELDLDFHDDVRLDKTVSAVAQRMGVELAWLAAPRCQLNVAVRGNDHELDAGVRHELAQMRGRVTSLTGKLRRPLIINGPNPGREHSAECRLLLTPLFVGRARHTSWLVLANPLSAPPFGGWHVLAALTLGQALARRLEVDLDRRTGLFNRGGLAAALPRLKSQGASMLMLDIDRLDSVNHLHGMAAGDAAIMSLAHLLAPPLLPVDALVGRTMGDQFAIVLPDVDINEAERLAERVQNAAASIQPGLPDDVSPMSLSIGVVEIDDTKKPLDRFAIDAETALKLAKDRGRSRIEVFSASSSTLVRRNDEVIAAADLREALRTGHLLLFAQPIRLLADRDAAPSFELLVRMRDVTGEIIAPSEFIAAAQRFQLLEDLDRFVVDAALKVLAPHRGLLSRQSSTVSINVTGQSLASNAFIDHLLEKLAESRIPGSLITIEVTEQAAVTNLERTAASMRRLRAAGCGIAIDDFGTGANSLAYLRELPVTRLKIDGSFIRDMLTNQRSEAGIKGMLQLAREYELDIVAEFVESEAIARRLAALGVQRGQGYLFGKPEPVSLALEKLAEEEAAASRKLFAEI